MKHFSKETCLNEKQNLYGLTRSFISRSFTIKLATMDFMGDANWSGASMDMWPNETSGVISCSGTSAFRLRDNGYRDAVEQGRERDPNVNMLVTDTSEDTFSVLTKSSTSIWWTGTIASSFMQLSNQVRAAQYVQSCRHKSRVSDNVD